MTCRHGAYDPQCSSYQSNIASLKRDYKAQIVKENAENTPDASNYDVVDVLEVGKFLVLRVNYPNCKKCSYEGTKIMVPEGVSTKDAIKWKTIDPHFRDDKKAHVKTEAPGPIARFPASVQGWQDAVDYAYAKSRINK